MKKQIISLMLTLIAILVSISAVSAADIYVNASAPSGGTGTITNPYQTIEDGVDNAADGDTVNIADGTYSGIGNYGIIIDHSINITGESQTGTIINGTGNHQIFNINPNLNVIIKNLTLVNGSSVEGGAIFNHGTLTVSDCTFAGNDAMGGGAISNSGGSCTINNCKFTDNRAIDGGAVESYGDTSNMVINGCTFTSNHASTGGGAIYISVADITITNCIFTGNIADGYGGAIINSNGDCTVSGCTFTGNNATSDGGVIYNVGDMTITGSIFNNNHAGDDGGAIYNFDTLTATGCNFYQNTAGDCGGAIYGSRGESSSTTIKYSRFVGNMVGTIAQDIYMAAGSLDARYNWWGSNNGPAAGRVVGNEGNLPSSAYTPWLVMNILPADPATIYTGGTSKITVNVYTDSAGVDHSADAAKFFSGPEVKFTTNLGEVGSKSVTVPWTLGSAFATLRGDEGPGIATVTATDANTTLSTTVTILQAPEVNAADTVGMQETGIPLAGLVLAILALFGGLAGSKRK